MPFPTTQRLKNLEQTVSNLEEQQNNGHPLDAGVFHGLVLKTVLAGNTTSSGCGSLGGYIVVVPFPPLEVFDEGHLDFDSHTDNPLDGVTDATSLVRVYSLNCPPILLGLFFKPGDVIEYWHYNGTGEQIGSRGDEENPDLVFGSFVTRVSPWEFYATVTFKQVINDGAISLNQYNFKALNFDPTAGQYIHFSEYKPCHSVPTFSNTLCLNVSETPGATPLADGTVVKVKRYFDVCAASVMTQTSSSSSGGSAPAPCTNQYEYWFEPVGAGQLPTPKYQGMVYGAIVNNQGGFFFPMFTNAL